MVARRRSRGFTLVELLTVIAIITVLASIILPTLSTIRKTGRKRTCANNLRELGMAVFQFENAKGRFPGSREWIARNPAVLADPTVMSPLANKWSTWIISVFPYCDNDTLFEAFNDPNVPLFDPTLLPGTPPDGPFLPTQPNTWVAWNERLRQPVPLVRCPSDITLIEEAPDTSYCANGGVLILPTVDPPPYDNQPAMVRTMNRNNGLFHDLIRNPRAQVAFDMIEDGAGQTVMLTENVQGSWYFFNGDLDQWGVPVVYPRIWENRLATMFYFLYRQGPGPVSPGQPAPNGAVTSEMQINGRHDNLQPIDYRYLGGTPDVARPSAYHGAGVNMVMADRSVVFVREKIDYRVYKALMTPWGRKADVPYQEFLLSPGDYRSD